MIQPGRTRRCTRHGRLIRVVSLTGLSLSVIGIPAETVLSCRAANREPPALVQTVTDLPFALFVMAHRLPLFSLPSEWLLIFHLVESGPPI